MWPPVSLSRASDSAEKLVMMPSWASDNSCVRSKSLRASKPYLSRLKTLEISTKAAMGNKGDRCSPACTSNWRAPVYSPTVPNSTTHTDQANPGRPSSKVHSTPATITASHSAPLAQEGRAMKVPDNRLSMTVACTATP